MTILSCGIFGKQKKFFFLDLFYLILIFTLICIAYSLNTVGGIVNVLTLRNKKFRENISMLATYMRKKGIHTEL